MTRMSWYRRVAFLLFATTLVAGCSATVDGAARPAPDATPHWLSGRTISRVLLGQSALSRIVKQPLEIDPRFPPSFGGPELLYGQASIEPADCLGVAVMLHPDAYQHGSIRNVALETWRATTESATVSRVKEAVVSLPTATDAEVLFAKFSRQWQACDGKTLPAGGRGFGLRVKVADVQATSSVVAAAISIELNMPSPIAPSIPAARAIGVRGNCLIEVEVDFSLAPNQMLDRTGDLNGSALDITQVMRDKVGALG
jgi:PknH-like extracellular domain